MKKLIYLALGIGFPVCISAQLQNLDFEVCDTSVVPHLEGENCQYLQGWTRTNGDPGSENMGFGFGANTGGVSDAQNGDMALRLSVFYHYDKVMAVQRAPFTSFPESLSGYYTYTGNVVSNLANQGQIEPDTATVRVLLSKWDNVLSQRDTIGFGELKLNQTLSYTIFTCPIAYTSTALAPDSIHILLNPSRVREGDNLYAGLGESEPECSFFTVDNLYLNGDVLGLEKAPENQNWTAFPNPGNGIIQIQDFIGEAKLTDLNGKVIDIQSYPEQTIDVSLLPLGVYLLHLTDNFGQVQYSKYVKQ